MGSPPFSEWQKGKPRVRLSTLSVCSLHGEIVLNALKGEISVEALKKLDNALRNKTLVDIANPLDFSKGMPPSLSVCNTDSLGERIQKALPETRVVKAFNTMSAHLQVNPQQLAGGDHHAFVSGNDATAKAQVIEIHKAYGWKNIIDLGDITTARGTEMLLPIWLRLWAALKDPMFNFKITRSENTTAQKEG
jgi:predicted dinucleotide-binding enzyme